MTNTAYAGGSTSKILRFRAFVGATNLPKTDLAWNTSGVQARYTRHGDTAQTITLVTATAGSYTSGGLVASNAAGGEYELHVPNAALVAGADNVDVLVYDGSGSPAYWCTSMHVEILGLNPRAAAIDANVEQINTVPVNGAGTSVSPWSP